MNISEDTLLQWLASYLLPFFRITAFMLVMPIFSGRAAPKKIRLLFSVGLTLAIVPTINQPMLLDPLSLESIFLIAQQVLIGVMMGFTLQVIFSAFVHGGQLVGMQMGLGFAQMMDPQTGVSVPVVSQFYNLFGILLFLSLNGHLIVISQLAESFQVFPLARGGLSSQSFYDLVTYGSWIFTGALIMALPVVVSLLMVTLVMGVITRATPQMNIFAVGFSISIVAGFVIMMFTLQSTAEQMTIMFENGLAFMTDVIVR